MAVASTKNKHFTSWFIEKLREMRVKLAAKLLIIAWTLMKKKEVFKPEYLLGGTNRIDFVQ